MSTSQGLRSFILPTMKRMTSEVSNAHQILARGSVESKRLAAKGRKAVAVVLTMKKRIERSFYAMGKALAVLDDPRIFHALGHPSFSALCSVDLGVSPAQADRLIHIVDSFSQAEAKRLTSTKATALIDLARAIGGKTTARGLIARGTVHVGKRTIDVRSANAARIARVAKELRDGKHRQGPGVHVPEEDARYLQQLARAVRATKIDATVEGIAAGAAEGARMRIVAHVRDAKKLARALVAALRS